MLPIRLIDLNKSCCASLIVYGLICMGRADVYVYTPPISTFLYLVMCQIIINGERKKYRIPIMNKK